MDRYDDLMMGLYRGHAPAWLPESSRELFARESLRRRCALGQDLRASFLCTMHCGQTLLGDDFAQRVYDAWPDTRFSAQNVITGLYLALDAVVSEAAGAAGADDDANARVVHALAHYEALAIPNLACAVRLPRADPARIAAAGLRDIEVYRFDFPIAELYARIVLYAAAATPAAFVRELPLQPSHSFVGRARVAGGWAVEDVTAYFETNPDEDSHDPAAVH